MPRDHYEVLGVARDADEREIKKAFRGWRASCTRTSTPTIPRPRTSSRRPPRPTRSSPTPSAARPTTATATRACAAAAAPRTSSGFGSLARHLRRLLRRRRVRRRRRPRRGPMQGGDVAAQRRDHAGARRRTALAVEVSYDAVARCEHCHGNGAEPGTPIETCERCGGTGELQAVSAHAVRPGRAQRRLRRLRRRRPGRRRRRARSATAAGRVVDRARSTSTSRRASPTASASACRPRPRGRARRPAGRPLRPGRASPRRPRFVRDGDDLVTVLDVPAPLAALGAHRARSRRCDGHDRVEVPAGTQPGRADA